MDWTLECGQKCSCNKCFVINKGKFRMGWRLSFSLCYKLGKINQFIQNREEIYYEDEVKKIVKELKGYVTT